MQYLLYIIGVLGGLVVYLKVKNNSAEALLNLFKFKSENADSEREISRLEGNLLSNKENLTELSEDLKKKKKDKPKNANDLSDWFNDN